MVLFEVKRMDKLTKNCIFVAVFMVTAHAIAFSAKHCDGFLESAGIIGIGVIFGALVGGSVWLVARPFVRTSQKR